MISKVGNEFLKQSSRAHDRMWATLSEAAKAKLIASGILKSKRVMANGLFKKFHNLNNQGEHLKDIKDWADKTYRVGLDKVKNTKNIEAIVKVPKDKKQLLKNFGGYSSEPAKRHGRKGAVPVVSILDPDAISRFKTPVHKLISKADDTAVRHNVSALHELYESKYLNKLRHVPAEHTGQAPIAKYTGKTGKGAVPVPQLESLFPNILTDEEGRVAKLVARHVNMGVLGREANDLHRLEQAGLGKVLSPITKFRKKTTESELLKKFTGKTPGVEKYTQKDIKKLEEETLNMGNRKLFARLFNPTAQGHLIVK